MLKGKTINNNIIILDGNIVNEISFENQWAKSTTFLSEEKAKEYYLRHVIYKKRGAKPYIKHLQATVYYNQLIIQL